MDDANILVLFDREEGYVQLMTEYLRSRRELPWEVHCYTDEESLVAGEAKGRIAVLAAAESVYSEKLKELEPGRMVVLNESGMLRFEDAVHINKYQAAENVRRELLELYAEMTEVSYPMLRREGDTCFIGFYSPVGSCLQTSCALTMGQLLAAKHRTLYMNFEYHAGIGRLLTELKTRDLADLLYFLTAEREKFKLRFESMVCRIGELDYIPPMRMGQNLPEVNPGDWQALFEKLGELGEYEYIILDLSESIRGLFDILRACSKVFTMTRDDEVSYCKLLHYEQVLRFGAYDDVLEKTKRCPMPHIRKLPADLLQLTKGELAAYVERQMIGE